MDTRMESLRQDVRKNPAELEREADRARDAVEATLHELERQLSPSELVSRVIATIKRNGGGFGHNLVDQVRTHPLPAVLAGVGIAWLMASSTRTEPRYAERTPTGARMGASDGAMQSVASAARTAASTVKGAANAVTDAAGRTASATRHAADTVTHASRGGVQRVAEGYAYLSREQPLVLGALAVVVGAAIGALLPSTDTEDEWLGDMSDEAKVRLNSEARGKADDLQAAAMSAAATVKQNMSKAANGTDAPADGGGRPEPASAPEL